MLSLLALRPLGGYPHLLPTESAVARCFLYRSLPSSSLRDAFCIARFLARCMFSYLPVLRSGLFSGSSALAFKPAHRELHERHGKTVRKLDHRYCHIAVRLCFQIKHVLIHAQGEFLAERLFCRLLAPLRRAKITEVRAK